MSDFCDPMDWSPPGTPLSVGFSRQGYCSGWPFPSALAFLLYSFGGKHFIHLFSRNSENLSPALSPGTRSSRPIVCLVLSKAHVPKVRLRVFPIHPVGFGRNLGVILDLSFSLTLCLTSHQVLIYFESILSLQSVHFSRRHSRVPV